jgi:glutamate carboxypeptidase
MVSHELIQGFLQDNLPTYIEILHRMVDINSFTSNAAGVNRLAQLTSNVFSQLDFNSEYVQSANPDYGNHLFLTRTIHRPPGQGTVTTSFSNPVIALISHLDTVFSPEEEVSNNFTWRPEGDRLYGPGTVDIKGGTVMIYMVLDALRTIAPQVFDSITWIIALDASEEVLSDDFGRLLLSRLPPETLACLVFESGTYNGGAFPLVVARKGRATFKVTAEGRSAHAGNAHTQGANAIVQLAHTVQQIAAFTDYSQQITFNVGTVNGGSVINRVPHNAQAEVEMRAFSPEVFRSGYERMLSLNGSSQVSSNNGFPCRVSVSLINETAPWPPNAGTERLYNLWTQTANRIGWQTLPEERGGLSDGNLLWEHIPTLDGLGPSGANAHCSERSPDGNKDQEYAQLSSFVPKAVLNSLALLALCSNPFKDPSE